MPKIDWTSFILGIIAVYLVRYLRVALAARTAA